MTTNKQMRTELVWPGKYVESGRIATPRVSLPFQVVEVLQDGTRVRPRQAQAVLPLFGALPGAYDDWRNKLIWGDNLLVESALLSEFSGKVDLIYLDPPFTTGTDFHISTQVGEGDSETSKAPSLVEEIAYRDTWRHGISSFLASISPRLELARDLLSPTGSLFLHCDWRASAHLRLLLDEVFGSERFVNEIAWCYSIGGKGRTRFGRKHDTIFFYSKTENYVFHGSDPDVMTPRKPNSHMRVKVDEDGNEYQEKTDRKSGKVYRYLLAAGKIPDDYWTDIEQLNHGDAERTGYPTQKPERLLKRIIAATTDPNGIVADFYCGSGTTLVAAEKLGRRWIGCDLGRFAIHSTRKRLLDISSVEPVSGRNVRARPFELLNLGRYERKHWQGVTFGNEPKTDLEAALTNYVSFMLELYGATPVSGRQHIHGQRAASLVHVGAVDAPVTIAQVQDAMDEARGLGFHELHVLAWEWEMGMVDPLAKLARTEHSFELRFVSIPREVMESRGSDASVLRFYDLAYLEIAIERNLGNGNLGIRVTLSDFVVPHFDSDSDELKGLVKTWSDYIDYWSVDWEFSDDTFVAHWHAYRTKQRRALELTTDIHTYKSPGLYRLLVKVVDIFGNDTSHLVECQIGVA